ncbi:MAG: hypothetical protein ACI8UQ_001733 [Bacteroidia bacterium]|jgi:hypothetical protein
MIKQHFLVVLTILCFSNKALSQVPSYLPADSLVGWYPFSASPNDESGNGYHGTRNGASLVSDRHGNAMSAYSFDGVNEYITLGSMTNSDFGQSYTQSCWIFLYDTDGGGPIGSKGRPWATPRIVPQSNKVQLYADATGHTNAVIAETGSINPNVWYHFTFVKDSNSYLIYMNGVLADSVYDPFTISPTNSAVYRIAASSPNFPFKGVIDDFAIWNRALNQFEISSVYNQCASTTITQQPSDQSVTLSNDAYFQIASSDSLATYQWQTDVGFGFQNISNAAQYSGAESDSLTVSNSTLSNNNQAFRCIVTSTECSDTSNAVLLIVRDNASIDKTTLTHSLSVYPNPTSNQIILRADASLVGSTYKLYSLKGKVLIQGVVTATDVVLNLKEFEAGVYQIRVEGGVQKSIRILKN